MNVGALQEVKMAEPLAKFEWHLCALISPEQILCQIRWNMELLLSSPDYQIQSKSKAPQRSQFIQNLKVDCTAAIRVTLDVDLTLYQKYAMHFEAYF